MSRCHRTPMALERGTAMTTKIIASQAGSMGEQLLNLPKQFSTVVPGVHSRGAYAGNVASRVAVIYIELRAHSQVHRLDEVALAHSELQLLPPRRDITATSYVAIELGNFVGRHARDRFRGFVKRRQPRALREVGEAAAQVHSWSRLANLVACGTETCRVDPPVARPAAALLQLDASQIMQGLHFPLLFGLDQRQAGGGGIQLDLVGHKLCLAAHLTDGALLGTATACATSSPALAAQGHELLPGTALFPPLLYPFGLWHIGPEDHGATLGGAAAQAAVPLLEDDALETDDRVPLEIGVCDLCLFAPQCDFHACGRVVGDRDVPL
mmetsp:Transcript_89609/g.252610  ORF Transcript_89609/g.252610 Transcript_89609/m.252610 type:complete len:325 (+) Transcript_89609:41-1015(+)